MNLLLWTATTNLMKPNCILEKEIDKNSLKNIKTGLRKTWKYLLSNKSTTLRIKFDAFFTKRRLQRFHSNVG